MLGYQAPIVEAKMEFDGDSWLGRWQQLHQIWVRQKIDPTPWKMVFMGQAQGQRCKHCYSLTHPSRDCDWAPTQPMKQPTLPPTATPRSYPWPRIPQLCYSWNHSPDPTCTFPNCKYLHSCIYCSKDPLATDKGHKVIHCPCRHLHQHAQWQGSSSS